jgi:hypothetical protein
MLIEIDLTPGEFRGMPASALANIHITELTDWSTKHNIQIHYMKRKNTITVWFNDDQTYSFFSLTFDPHPVYNTQFNVLIEDYKCPWRIVSDKNPPEPTPVNIAATDPVGYDLITIEDIKKSLTIVNNFTK